MRWHWPLEDDSRYINGGIKNKIKLNKEIKKSIKIKNPGICLIIKNRVYIYMYTALTR